MLQSTKQKRCRNTVENVQAKTPVEFRCPGSQSQQALTHQPPGRLELAGIERGRLPSPAHPLAAFRQEARGRNVHVHSQITPKMIIRLERSENELLRALRACFPAAILTIARIGTSGMIWLERPKNEFLEPLGPSFPTVDSEFELQNSK